MHSNGTLPLPLMLDALLAARCGYSLKHTCGGGGPLHEGSFRSGKQIHK